MGARHDLRFLPGHGARLLAILAAVAAAVSILLAAATAASAHASLLRSTPPEGGVVGTAPSQVTLSFSEPVTPLVLRLIMPDGASRSLVASALGADVTVGLPAGDWTSGTYLLSWRVVSSDGHPVAGTLTFSIGAPGAAPPVAPTDEAALHAVLWVAKLALYLALFLGAGGAVAAAWLAPRSRSGMGASVAFACLGLVAAPASLGLQGLDALGAPLTLFGQAVTWQAATATSYGLTAAIAFVALAFALLSLASEGALAKWLSLAALAGTGAALAASGHASAAPPQWLSRAMVFVHAAGITFWAGALLPLGLALRRRTTDAGEALDRFSMTIPLVVAALLAAGLVLAFIQVREVSALVTTDYGRLLLLKLVLVLPLLLLAVVNRLKLTKPALAEQPAAQRLLSRNIMLETLLMAAILAVVAGFRFTPPPRILAIEAAEPASIHIHTEEAMAEFSVLPGRAGKVAASVVLMTADFGPLDASGVTIRFTRPDAAPVSATAHKPGDGTWRVDELILPVPGTWTAEISIQTGENRATLAGEIAIRP